MLITTEELNQNFVKDSNSRTEWNAFVMMVQIYLNIIAMYSVVVDINMIIVVEVVIAYLRGIACVHVNYFFYFLGGCPYYNP